MVEINEDFIEKIQRNNGEWIELENYAMRILWDRPNGVIISVFAKIDSHENHNALNKEQVIHLIKDLQDLSDWRHYRRLMKKLGEENES